MQVIQLTGRLVADATLKAVVRQGLKNEFVSFSLACNEEYGDEKSTTFYDVTMPKTGVLQYLKKGQQVSLVGRFRFTQSKNAEGKDFFHLNVSCFTLELTGGPKKANQEDDLPEGPTQA